MNLRSLRSPRLVLLLLALGLSFAPLARAAGKFKVVTTFTVIQDIARNVAGDAAVVELITKPGAEIHDYQPTPKDIVKTQSAQLILWNGLESGTLVCALL